MKQTSEEQQSRKKQTMWRMIVLIVLAVILVVLAVVCTLYVRWVKRPVLPPDHPVTQTDPPVGEEPLELDAVQPKVSGARKSEEFYTILVVGVDTSSHLTDTIMLVSYDITNQRAGVMSIPRDTILNAGAKGVDNKKINAVYARYGQGQKGIEALKREVSELVGFLPDYHIFVEWDIVGRMVDAIGGVSYTVPWDMFYWDPTQDLKIDLQEGTQVLNGDQAMQLVRWRKNMDRKTYSTAGQKSVGDTGRLELQQDFLKSVLKQTLQIQNVTRIGALAELFSSNVVSDLTVENLFWFAQQAILGGLSVDQVDFFTMPYGYGEYRVAQSGGGYQARSYVYPLQNKLLECINSSLSPFVEKVGIGQLDLIRPNSAGGISSTTGVLADPTMATAPVLETQAPDDSGDGGQEDGMTIPSDPPEDSPAPEQSAQPEDSAPPEQGAIENNPPSEQGEAIEDSPPPEQGEMIENSAPPEQGETIENSPPPEQEGFAENSPPPEQSALPEIPQHSLPPEEENIPTGEPMEESSETGQ